MRDNPTLTASQIDQIRAVAGARTVQEGEVLYEPSQAEIPMFVVISGQVSISRPGEQEKVVAVRGPGQFTGEMSVISGKRSLLRAFVSEDGAMESSERSC